MIDERQRQEQLKQLLMASPVRPESDNTKFLKAYLISIVLCPFGLVYVVKYFFLEDEKKAALICLILTIVVGVIELIALNAFLGSANLPNPSDLLKIVPSY